MAKRSIHTDPDRCQVGGRRQHDRLQVAPTVRFSIVHQQHNRQPATSGQVLKPVGVQKVQIVIEQNYLGVFLPDARQQFGRRIAPADDPQSFVVPKRLHQTTFLLPADAE